MAGAQRAKERRKGASTGDQPAQFEPDGGAQPHIRFEKELWDAAVRLRGNVAPADYKHYVLPLLFLRYLSLKYEGRREQLEFLIGEESSEHFTRDPVIAREILNDPDEYKSAPFPSMVRRAWTPRCTSAR